jgi:adenine-specific DNA-methyltransferase
MNSLLVKEGMAGKVQMIYVDPPYGIKYSSNFQPRIDRRDVKDKDEDLTHEPEQIKAYRDTWTLGIHSYLTYLRDRLLLCRELLTESGSIFVQINDENLHLVRCLLDEVFGRENFVAVVAFQTAASQNTTTIPRLFDYLLWYGRDVTQLKVRRLYRDRTEAELLGTFDRLEPGGRRYKSAELKTDDELEKRRLREAGRLTEDGKYTKRYPEDFSVIRLHNVWDDTVMSTYSKEKVYAVQTNTKVIERCILMTTDPGDLVFDPTCGSGTTAWCAEKWGRRWITCDTSRVALAIARQRLMTAKFDYYELKDPERGPAGGFNYETVPHITLESIAKNTEIDAIAARYQPQIDQALTDLNRALGREWKEWEVPREVPHPVWPQEARDAYARLRTLKNSLRAEDQEEATRLLELIYQRTGHRWELNEIPGPMPPADWPAEARDALARFWELKHRKRQEIDASIQRNAPQETLYDRPRVMRGVVRVSGPFTVEAIPLPAVEDPAQAPIPQFEDSVGVDPRVYPDAGQPQGVAPTAEPGRISDRAGDYLTNMVNLLKQQSGVLFPGGKKLELSNIRPLHLGYLHAEAEARQNGNVLRVAISFGPQHGPVIARQVEDAIPAAKVNGYQVLIFAGFAFDPEAQAFIQKVPVAGLQVHFANIAPDVLVGDLLKTTRASQIFTVFGQPDVRVEKQQDGTYRVELRGVDIYDPLTGEVHSTRGEDVAAWFLDTDYDSKTFKISQAFFPGDPDAWEKLQRALRAQIPPEAFEQMRGTVSFPFEPGEHRRIAVKVIDFRGNEVVRVIPLNAEQYR